MKVGLLNVQSCDTARLASQCWRVRILLALGEAEMESINFGSTIKIPCEVKPGPFSGEHLISFQTLEGAVSGFVHDKDISKADDGWFVLAIVKEIFADSIVVMVKGSFFNTNGIATVSRDLAMAA